ncbi:MAG: hypothetical protein ACRD5J_13765, partial [Nitrososphaeraceae archaeon]
MKSKIPVNRKFILASIIIVGLAAGVTLGVVLPAIDVDSNIPSLTLSSSSSPTLSSPSSSSPTVSAQGENT